MIWHSALAYLGEATKLSQFSPVFGNEDFPPGRADSGFRMWASHGVAKISDLFKDNASFLTFEELKASYRIPSKHFFFNIFKLGALY